MPSSDRNPATDAPRIGHRYAVLERLGRGGTAVVYRVRDESRGGDFALKQLVLRGSSADGEMRAQFEREFSVLAQLSHPSVIEVHDFGVAASGPYYTMELLDGGDLSSLAPMDPHRVCELALQICSSLSLLHSRRLVHRDVSPRNVRCTRQGSAKLIDFGAMAPMGLSPQVVGTPSFVAPEVVHQLALDARTDLFSLGATLYFALTGRKPFAARALSELNAAWREPPVPPSQFAPAVPPALDALVLSLLRIDPGSRPRGAFEVIQRLTAIAGTTQAEPEQIAQAYLATPALVGRDKQERRFLQRLRTSLQGEGGSLFFEGEPGAGRTRLLDACMVSAKIAGATVLRVNGRATAQLPLAAARTIAEQVLEQLPQLAGACARAADLDGQLFSDTSAELSMAQLRPLASFASDRARAQTELTKWLSAVCERRPLVIALDDIERIDDASLGWIAAWMHGASELPRLIIATVQSSTDTSPRLALHALREKALRLTLAPLTAEQTKALFASMFLDAPHVALVSQRVQRIAAGNLRESMALARYLIARRLIRYAEGNWILPAELPLSDLPASAEDAARARVALLSQLASNIAQTQALAFEGPWTRGDYLEIAGPDHECQVDDAVAMLVREHVLIDLGGTYTLSDLGMRACLVADMNERERAERHLALAELCVRSNRPTIVEVHHRLLGGRADQALDRLMPLLASISAAAQLFEPSGLDRRTVAAILERAKAQAGACGRPARDAHVICQRLIELSLTTSAAMYHAHAPGWSARLELDSGLHDYLQTDPAGSSEERLSEAQQRARARHAATPEHERVYEPDEAQHLLAHAISMSFTIALKASESRLQDGSSAKLAPFSRVSPLLHGYFQYTLAVPEVYWLAQPERGLSRLFDVDANLEQLAKTHLAPLDTLRTTVASTAAVAAVTFGDPSAEHWIQIMERHTLQQHRALNLRRILCIYDGDMSGADRYRKDAELLAIQNDGRTLAPVLLPELAAHLHAGDLAGVKHVAERIEQLALKATGWRALHQLARAVFERMRGDLAAALEAIQAAFALSAPANIGGSKQRNVWVAAAAEYVAILTELERASEARVGGLALCRQCEQLQIGGLAAGLQRALALAEAKLGDHAGAARRLDALIAERAQLRPSFLAPDYEARARVAIAAKDPANAERFAKLACAQRGSDAGSLTHDRLFAEAAKAGLTLDVPASGFESVVLGGERRVPLVVADSAQVASVTRLRHAAARAQRVLELLASTAGAHAGYLYYAQESGLACAARLHAAPDAALDRFANGYFQQQVEGAAMTTIFTAVDGTEGPGASWTSSAGSVYRIALLQSQGGAVYLGLVALSCACDSSQPDMSLEYRSLSNALSAQLLDLCDATAVWTG
jgi:hypothetical protein